VRDFFELNAQHDPKALVSPWGSFFGKPIDGSRLQRDNAATLVLEQLPVATRAGQGPVADVLAIESSPIAFQVIQRRP